MNSIHRDVVVPIDFGGAVPAAEELPPDLLDTEPLKALSTVAALLSTPAVGDSEPCFASQETLAVRLLALYGAGALFELTQEQHAQLDARAESFAQTCGKRSLATFAGFARRRALMRARGETGRIIFKGVVPAFPGLDLSSERGYSNVDNGLPENFPQLAAPLRLVTYAALFAACEPKCLSRSTEAIVMLSLYGAGARIDLTKEQFRTLENRAKTYVSRMRAERFCEFANGSFATDALFQARKRARREAII